MAELSQGPSLSPMSWSAQWCPHVYPWCRDNGNGYQDWWQHWKLHHENEAGTEKQHAVRAIRAVLSLIRSNMPSGYYVDHHVLGPVIVNSVAQNNGDLAYADRYSGWSFHWWSVSVQLKLYCCIPSQQTTSRINSAHLCRLAVFWSCCCLGFLFATCESLMLLPVLEGPVRDIQEVGSPDGMLVLPKRVGNTPAWTALLDDSGHFHRCFFLGMLSGDGVQFSRCFFLGMLGLDWWLLSLWSLTFKAMVVTAGRVILLF